jgi:hypothetical protein
MTTDADEDIAERYLEMLRGRKLLMGKRKSPEQVAVEFLLDQYLDGRREVRRLTGRVEALEQRMTKLGLA